MVGLPAHKARLSQSLTPRYHHVPQSESGQANDIVVASDHGFFLARQMRHDLFLGLLCRLINLPAYG